jgi:uncharacterized membrane protein
VFAIAITLLVLEVRVPSPAQIRDSGSLAVALLHGWPSYLSYLVTFLTVAVIWLNHHSVFRKIRAMDRTLQWWNLLLLLTVSFTPFPNALIAEYLPRGLLSEEARTAAVVYALVFAVGTVPWLFIWHHLRARPVLLSERYGSAYAGRRMRRSLIGTAAYAIGIGIAAAVPLLALVLFLAAAAFYTLTAGGSDRA